MDFPTKSWEQMDEEEQAHFRNMSEEKLIRRWESAQGEEIQKKIVAINFEYGTSSSYRDFVGTVKTGWGNEAPKIDLRGINFAGFSNLENNEIFGFDFSNCSLNYSNFSDAAFTSSVFTKAEILYSDFSNSILEGCDFCCANLNMTNFAHCRLESADFRNSWINEVSFQNSDLGYIKYNRKTDFFNIDLAKVRGSSNPLFIVPVR